MRRRNLKSQLKHVVCESKRIGHSKRAEKKNGVDTEAFLYSHKSVKKMFALCNKLANWLKENEPKIKLVKDITPEHIQAFCEANLDHWKNSTRKEYQSRIRKLGKMISRVYHIERDYSSVEIHEARQKQKNPPMTREDYSKLQETIRTKKTSARYLPDIVYRIGARNEEARSIKAEDIDLKAMVVRLNNCKNGKRRTVPIREEDYEFFLRLKKLMIRDHWENACNGISENSANKAIRDAMKACGISSKYRQSLHAIRKLYAVERMKEEINKGFDKRTSWEHVQRELGHGPKFRGDLFYIYIGQFYDELNLTA